VPFTTPSDGRFKYQVQDDVKGLSFIMQLHPVTYHFDVQRFDEQQGNPEGTRIAKPVNYAIQASYKEAAGIRRSGFIAQEVEKAANATGYDFSGIIKPKTAQEHYGLSYEAFVVPLVKAVQELGTEVERLKKENEAVKKTNEQLLQSLQQQIDELRNARNSGK
jgi:endosialidase-like protein